MGEVRCIHCTHFHAPSLCHFRMEPIDPIDPETKRYCDDYEPTKERIKFLEKKAQIADEQLGPPLTEDERQEYRKY